MNWKEVIEKIKGPKRFLAVGVVFGDQANTYAVVEAHLKDKELDVQNKYMAQDLEELLQSLPKNVPIALAFSGQKIITKESLMAENYKAKILFNADPDDFYWYELVQGEKVFASIVRKDDIDGLLDRFTSVGLSVLDIAIGPLVVHSVKPLLKKDSRIEVDGHTLEFLNDELSGIKKGALGTTQREYSFGEEKIPQQYVLPFASMVNQIYPNENLGLGEGFLEQNREDFKFKKAFNALGLVLISGFFLLLLTSYFLLGHYQDKYMDLQVEIGEQNVAYNKLIALENDKKNKEAILNESGLTDSNFLSFYALHITQKVPEDITLTDLSIFPVTSRIKPKERVVFHNNLISLQGSAISNTSFTQWIKDLRQLDWIENLEIADFTKNGDLNFFELKLTVRFDVQ